MGQAVASTVNKLLDQPPRVSVLVGPARCGKSQAVLELYRRRLDELGRPGCLLLLPNAATAAYMRRRLMEAALPVLIAPAMTTFAALAGRILAAAGRPARVMNPVQRRMLLESVVRELLGAGKLTVLGGLADTPGLAAALDQSIAELKRAAIEPETLAKAIDPDSAKDADLLSVYRLYQQHLLATNRFDTEGVLWLARDVLKADRQAAMGYEGISAVAADGFTDFTPTQMEILSLLSRRVEATVITLPLVQVDDGHTADGRTRLWQWTRRTLERLRRAMPEAKVVTMEADDPLETLFDLSGAGNSVAAVSAAPVELSVLAAADVESEVRWVARQVKSHLASGEPGGSVAVLARSLAAYAEPIQRVFADCHVPLAPSPALLKESGVIRYVLRLLSLPPKCEYPAVLAAIKSSYFRPAAVGDFDGTTVAVAEMAIRTANVLGGRQAYRRAFGRLAARARMQQAPGQPRAIDLGPLLAEEESLAGASAMLEALLGRLEAVAAAQALPAYSQAVRELLAQMQLEQAACACGEDELAAADLRALRALEEVLGDLAAPELTLAPPAAGPERAEWLYEMLSRAVSAASCPAARGESAVAVLDVLDARAMSFDQVYLLGLNEKSFPQLAQERCFIDEADRAAWARRGLELDRRSDLIGREMLLFYLACSRARKALHVSYVSDAGGSTQAASGFLEELLAMARREGRPVAQRRIPPGQFLPEPAQLANAQEALMAAAAAAFGEESAAARPLLGWAGANCPQAFRAACHGIVASARRWSTAEPDCFDGVLDDPAMLSELASTIPSQHVFSASELTSYAQCPWQFFARRLLGLEELEEPQARLSPIQRGSFCHSVLWRVMSELSQRHGRPVRLGQVDLQELRQVLQQAVAIERNRLSEQAMYSQLWEAQTAAWGTALWKYLQQQAQAGQENGWACLFFELAFGLAGVAKERTDPASVPEPAKLSLGKLEIRLAGKIDRVDAARDGQSLLAVDYKAGRLPTASDVLSGRDLQLVLYAQALEALAKTGALKAEGATAGGLTCIGGAYHSLREDKQLELTLEKMPSCRSQPKRQYEEVVNSVLEQVAEDIRQMQAGRFPAVPDAACPPFCAYRRICQFAPFRAIRKQTSSRSSNMPEETTAAEAQRSQRGNK